MSIVTSTPTHANPVPYIYQEVHTPYRVYPEDTRDRTRPETIEAADRRWWAGASFDIYMERDEVVIDDDLIDDAAWEAMYQAGRDDHSTTGI